MAEVKYFLTLVMCAYQMHYLFVSTAELTSMKTKAKFNASCKADSDCDSTFQLKCVSGVCNCETTTFPDDDGECKPKGGLLHRCKLSSECQEDKGLYCNQDKLCFCNGNKGWIPHRRKRSCVMLAGHGPPVHTSNFECVMNAHYNESTRKCQCDAACESKYGFCIVSFGEKCNVRQSSCGLDKTCVRGSCKCKFTDKGPINGTCYSKVNERCFLNWNEISNRFGDLQDLYNITLPCTSNAVCSPSKHDSSWFICQCLPGYAEVAGECRLDTDGYIAAARRKLIGEACTLNAGNDTTESCTTGAYCKDIITKMYNGRRQQSQATLQLVGVCVCAEGYRYNKNNTCYKT